jgi:dolichol-phosphate mannosyltransferase
MQTVSIILPTFNENKNIGPLIDSINALEHPQIIEVIVVDDNSPDGTSNTVKNHPSYPDRTKLIQRFTSPGLVDSLNDGIKSAKGEIILWLDADGQMPASLIPELISKQNEGYEISMGSRFIKGASDERYYKNGFIVLSQKVASLIMCHFFYRILRLPAIDISSGYVAVKKSILQGYSLKGNYGEYFLDFIIHAKDNDFSLIEIPYILGRREFGESKSQKGGYIGMLIIGFNFIKVAFRKRD